MHAKNVTLTAKDAQDLHKLIVLNVPQLRYQWELYVVFPMNMLIPKQINAVNVIKAALLAKDQMKATVLRALRIINKWRVLEIQTINFYVV